MDIIGLGIARIGELEPHGDLIRHDPSLEPLIRSQAMTEANIPAVGIDLGTTFSVVAKLDERGQPVTLVNAEGDRLTPSVVLIDGDDVVVGKEAMKAMSSEADHVAECASATWAIASITRRSTASSIRPR